MVFGGKKQRSSCGCHRNIFKLEVRLKLAHHFEKSYFQSFPSTRTRRLSEDEALQRTIKFYNLSSSTPSLENVIKGTKIEKNAIFGMDNLKEYLLSKPPPNFFVDLSKIPIEDWRHKYMLASGKMKVPCLLLSLSDVSVLYHVRDE